MSQSVIFVGKVPDLKQIPGVEARIVTVNQPYLLRVAREYVKAEELQHCWYAEETDWPSHRDLWDEAQVAMVSNKSLSSTRLGLLLRQAIPVTHRILAWWADYWEDLPGVHTEQALLALIEEQLLDESGAGEVYFDFRKASPTECGP